MGYSHLLLLGKEVEYVWTAPFRPSSALYLTMRYFGLLYILISAGLSTWTPGVRHPIMILRHIAHICIVSDWFLLFSEVTRIGPVDP